MTRIICGICLAAAIGCTNVQPIGPFANNMGGSPKAKGKEAKNKDDLPAPVTVPAVKPTPPMNLIYPDEVSPENPQAAVQKLRNELESDGKNIPSPPMTAEVSRYKGGVKQN
jgi:hypothetical protein